ncbi:MAG: DUF4956 domain-containing protein [Candidatus Aureabacteria bacterium]|nr:DUF4956 domain-containing protein [Candidatus Auribacterota bacterium]
MNNLFQTIQNVKQTANKMDPSLFALALAASLIAALFAGFLYNHFYENKSTGSQVNRAFPLLAISITTLFIGIQMSLPLSLGLLGALSIIRFRTPIKDPEEVGFIMLVIASSISCSTFNFQFLLVLNLTAFITMLLVRGIRVWKYKSKDGILFLSIADGEALAHLHEILLFVKSHTRSFSLETSSARDGITSLQISFLGLKTEIPQFHSELNKQIKIESLNFFFSKQGGIRG